MIILAMSLCVDISDGLCSDKLAIGVIIYGIYVYSAHLLSQLVKHSVCF